MICHICKSGSMQNSYLLKLRIGNQIIGVEMTFHGRIVLN